MSAIRAVRLPRDGSLRLGGALQRRTLLVLATGTILSGFGVGASLSVGALLLAEVSGNDAISGLASTTFGVGAAAAGIPLARLASRRGRRPALVTGNLVALLGAFVAIFSTVIGQWWVLCLGIALIGVASAVQLLSRFAAADLALPEKRARDLSLVVWSITVGAVIGPLLIGPGAVIGEAVGITPLAGVFVFALVAQMLAALVNWAGLRPDPLLTARTISAERAAARPDPSSAPADAEAGDDLGDDLGDPDEGAPAAGARRRALILTIFAIAMAQAIMVGLMAMTPLHLMHHEGTAELVGVTLSLHIAGMYALSPVFGSLAGRFGCVPVMVLGWVVLLVAIPVAYLSGSSHLAVQIAMTLVGVGWGAVTVAGAALLTELTNLAERPRWQGRSDTFMSASGALAGALSGVGFALGDFALLALFAGGLLALGAVASIQLGVHLRRR